MQASTANGIVAARGGKSLIVVKSNTGELLEVDAATGVADRIELTGGDGELINADGMLLKGRKLYVVENQDDPGSGAAGVGVISVVKLARNLSTAGSPARSTATCSRSRPPSRAPAVATTWSMRSSACPTPTARRGREGPEA